MLSSHLRLDIQSSVSSSAFPVKTLHQPLMFVLHVDFTSGNYAINSI
jgi:hypothetical protein